MTSGLATSASSVKLRRKNRESVAEAEKKRNRYSGGDFLLGSPARGHNMRNSQAAQPQVTGTGHSGIFCIILFQTHLTKTLNLDTKATVWEIFKRTHAVQTYAI